ncbi:MAG: Hsp20/alpha crystallin family protein [Rectinemataceae bacterium]
MKNGKSYVDIGSILDDVFEAAKDFGEKFKNFDPGMMGGCGPLGGHGPMGSHGPMGGHGPMGEHDPMGGPGPADEASDGSSRGPGGMGGMGARGSAWFETGFDENADYYPNFSYPPLNVYLTPDRSMVFEFALAGFDEKNISLSFQGDYMVFSARIDLEPPVEGTRYFKRRLKLKDVDKQKYFVPADKFDQEKVKAIFRNGILKVIIPQREEPPAPEGIKIEIVREGE